jgi:outer membrane protein OmpA-like peptidoglycan-associated protein
VPAWSEEGPNAYTAILDGATAAWDPVAGAINGIAVDPGDRFTIYLATVNGGIWRNTGSTEVRFATDESALTDDDRIALNAFAEFLEAHPGLTVEIGGHTDSSGAANDNMALSLARAQSVRDYLVDQRHIEASRLQVKAYGETRPVADNLGGDQALNRRVELLVENWQPLTDEFQSLSTSTIAISPLSGQVLYAGIGRTSSFSSSGGAETGLLYSSDRGEHWKVLGTSELRGLTITKVLPSTLTTPSGAQVVFVSTFDVDRDGDDVLDDRGGLFRLEVAADGTAESIAKISDELMTNGLMSGHYTDLALDPGIASDPTRPVRVYAANPAEGVYAFTDGGIGTWELVSTGFELGDNDGDGVDDLLQEASRIKLAIHEGTGTLYAGVLGPVDANGIFQLGASRTGLIGVFKTEDFGANWDALPVPTTVDNGTTYGLHPGRQGDIHFSIAVDPTDEDIVYLGGDRQGDTQNNAAGLSVFGGRIFAYDDLNGSWDQLVGNNADGTVPHADSRGMVFAGAYTLYEISDGGLSRLQNPRGEADQGTRRWESMNEGLFINEVLRLAYDTVNNDILVGSQDNGSAHQGAGSTDGFDNDGDGAVDEADEAAFWSGTGGDGNSQAAIPIDMDGDGATDRVLRYSLHNNFSFLQVYEYTAAGVLIDASGNPANAFRNIGLRAPGNATALSGLNAQDTALSFDIVPMVVNANDPTRMLIAYAGIYESVNTSIAPAASRACCPSTRSGRSILRRACRSPRAAKSPRSSSAARSAPRATTTW